MRMHYTGRWDGIDCSGQMFGSVISPGLWLLVVRVAALTVLLSSRILYHLSTLLFLLHGENVKKFFSRLTQTLSHHNYKENSDIHSKQGKKFPRDGPLFLYCSTAQ